MAIITWNLPIPLTALQITNLGAMLVTAINNASNTQTAETAALAALNTQLTAAQAQVTADLAGDPQILAADVLVANSLQTKITNQTAAYNAAIATSNSNATLLAKDLARGFSIGPVQCTTSKDANGNIIVTRNDTGQVIPGVNILPKTTAV